MFVRTALSCVAAVALCTTAPAAQAPGEVIAEVEIGPDTGGFGGDLDFFDRFGSALAPLGDLDGDGNEDVAVGAPGDDDGGFAHGAVWILLLDADGTVKSQTKISDSAGGFSGDLDFYDRFGAALCALGDLDGDGVVDLAVGSPRDDDGGPFSGEPEEEEAEEEEGDAGPGDGGLGFNRGAVWVLFLNADGTVKSHAKISDASGGFGGDLDAFDSFGSALALMGDVEGGEFTGLAVGAPGDDDGGHNRGAVWMLSLDSDGAVAASTKISAAAGDFTGELDDDDRFGAALAALSDLDGNETRDLAVGAPGDDDGGGEQGAVWSLLLSDGGDVIGHNKLSATSGAGLTLAPSDRFGSAVTQIGDFDGDGVGELAIGAPGDDSGGTNRGAVWLLFPGEAFASTGAVSSVIELSSGNGGFAGELEDRAEWGSALARGGDLDGDGVAELFVGAPRDNAEEDEGEASLAAAGDGGFPVFDTGAMWVLFQQAPPAPPAGEPYEAPVAEVEGLPGRSTLVQPPVLPGDDFVDEPVVVVPKRGDSKVTVLVGQQDDEGDVRFTESGELSTGEAPSEAEDGSFFFQFKDAGGFNDVVVANEGSHSFSLFPGTGVGEFGPGTEFSLLPANGAPVALGVGDFNNDELLDVVLAGDQGVSVFLGDGLGGFPVSTFTPVDLLTDLDVGFVNADADLDVVTTSGRRLVDEFGTEEGFATVLLGNGDGTFAAPTSFAPGTALASVLLGDLDDTAGVDALVAAHAFAGGLGGEPQGSLELYVGDGAGGFSASTAFAGFDVPNDEGIHPTFGALQDLDGDELLDAVYTSSDNIARPLSEFADEQPPLVVTVLRNDGTGGFDVTEVGTAYVGKGVAPILEDIVPDDDEGVIDSVLVWYDDVLAGLPGSAPGEGATSFITVLEGDGEAGFFDPVSTQFATGDGPGDAAVTDVNGSGGGLGFAGADGAPSVSTSSARLDLVVPNAGDNSISVLLGDGAGGIRSTLVIEGVDDLDPLSLPPGEWRGGPRALVTGNLDGDPRPDAVIYNEWRDTAEDAPSPLVFASLSVFAAGQDTKTQYLPLPRGGEFVLADVHGDDRLDAVITQRLGPGGPDGLRMHRGLAGASFDTTPRTFPAPEGFALTGGLDVLVDGSGGADGLPAGASFVTTATDLNTGEGAVVVYANVPPTLVPQVFPMGIDWDRVRSVALGDVTGDGRDDVVVGLADSRLAVAQGLEGGGFAPAPVSPMAAAVGGGALRLADLDGDTRLDIVSCTTAEPGAVDQAFVRTLLGQGDAAFEVRTLGGIASTGPQGALRPLLADMNLDGAVDLVLIHGTSNALSILVNQLSRFETYGGGKAGSGGVTPTLEGRGYTTPGGAVVVEIGDALGGATALLRVGTGRIEDGFLHVANVLVDLLLPLSGAPGQTGVGGAEIGASIPDVVELLGLEVTLQVLVGDPGAGLPAPFSLAASNGLAMTIVE